MTKDKAAAGASKKAGVCLLLWGGVWTANFSLVATTRRERPPFWRSGQHVFLWVIQPTWYISNDIVTIVFQPSFSLGRSLNAEGTQTGLYLQGCRGQKKNKKNNHIFHISLGYTMRVPRDSSLYKKTEETFFRFFVFLVRAIDLLISEVDTMVP
jgi:hypothetical protein